MNDAAERGGNLVPTLAMFLPKTQNIDSTSCRFLSKKRAVYSLIMLGSSQPRAPSTIKNPSSDSFNNYLVRILGEEGTG